MVADRIAQANVGLFGLWQRLVAFTERAGG
jgi:hypothetical protein